MGEEGLDGGGPRREFFRLFANEVRDRMCFGNNAKYFFRHDVTALQVSRLLPLRQYCILGNYIAFMF